MLKFEIMDSPAYLSLNKSHRSLLPYFLRKAWFNPRDQDCYKRVFVFPYGEAVKRWGYSAGTFSDAVKDLTRKGFLDPVFKGGVASVKSLNRYRLSERWKRYGKPDFVEKEWPEIPSKFQ